MTSPGLTPPAWLKPGRVLVVLILAHVALKLVLAPRMLDSPFTGDEQAYLNGARALSDSLRDLLSLDDPDTEALRTHVVGNGWFMPGMSLVLLPLYLLDPDAGPAAVRAFLGTVSFLLLLLVVQVVRRTVGDWYAAAILVVPCLLPVWVEFSFTAWGDATAGLVVVLLFALLLQIGRGLRTGSPPTLLQGLLLGLLAVTCLYLRSSTLPLVGGLLVLVVLAVVGFLRSAALRRGLVAWALAVLTFVALLAPWSLAATKSLDATVVTTTTVPLSMAVTFGDEDRLCFGPCEEGNPWFNAVRYSRAVARESGVGELEIQQRMSDYALSGLTRDVYLHRVAENFDRHLFQPASFADRFHLEASDPGSSWVARTTTVGYFAFLALLAGALLLVTRASFGLQASSLLVKAITAALLLQPFVHQSGGRYWMAFGPMLGIAAALLAHVLLVRRSVAPAGPDAPVPALTWLQAFAAAAVVVGGVAVVVGA